MKNLLFALLLLPSLLFAQELTPGEVLKFKDVQPQRSAYCHLPEDDGKVYSCWELLLQGTSYRLVTEFPNLQAPVILIFTPKSDVYPEGEVLVEEFISRYVESV